MIRTIVHTRPRSACAATGPWPVLPRQQPQPEVSIVMVVHNEEHTIDAALDSALAQVTGQRLEVVVADGSSDDGTRRILDARAAVEPRMRVVDNPGRTTPKGLNTALREARGEYWVRLDGHSRFTPSYVETLMALLREGRCEAAGGVVRAVGESPFGRAVALVQSSRFGVGNAGHHYARSSRWVDHVSHGAYRLDISRAIGGFDETLLRNQDYDFDYRYRQTGARVLLEPAVTFERAVRETPRALARQQFEYGFWKYVVLRRHPDSLHLRWLAPPALVTALAGGTVLAWTWAGRRLLLASLGSYGALVSVAAARLGGGADAWRVASALTIVHLAWGSGFAWAALTCR